MKDYDGRERRDRSISSGVFYFAIPILLVIALSIAYFWMPGSRVNQAQTNDNRPSPSAPAPPAVTPNTEQKGPQIPHTQTAPAEQR